jgi:hypothetical protein
VLDSSQKIGQGYQETDARMAELAARCPDSLVQPYTSADGEHVAIIEFESHETVAAWREHPEHREAQRLGRERWFSEYRITVCDAVRDYSLRNDVLNRDQASSVPVS